MLQRWPLHLVLLAVLAAGVGVAFLQPPGFGDDLTYWAFATKLHEQGMPAWELNSFHELRWPVWGLCWLLQGCGLRGVESYQGVPIFYLVAGAMCAFTFARLATRSVGGAWVAGIAFCFSPLIDQVAHRPMPDLSEGVWGAVTLLTWWRLMEARSRGPSIAWAFATGIGVFIAESNRLTGVFIVPVLIVGTLLFARRRFWWLVGAGAVAAGLYLAENAMYHGIFQEWWHSVKANLGGKDRRRVVVLPLWQLPFRFVNPLFRAERLSPWYFLASLLGLAAVALAARRPASESGEGDGTRPPVAVPIARLMALWYVFGYLLYACAPQSVSPWKPIVRDAARFLGSLAVPQAVLGAIGLCWLFGRPWLRSRRAGRWLPEHPVFAGLAALVILAAGTSRPSFDRGFLPAMADYLHHVPDGTRVFTHDMMRSLTLMADPSVATRLRWLSASDILEQKPALEAKAATADEFWYMRKAAWMNARKRLEKKDAPPVVLGSYFQNQSESWALARMLVKGDSPDIVFYRRRTPEMPVPPSFDAASPELAQLFGPLPLERGESREHYLRTSWAVPESFRGKILEIGLEDAADQVEAADVTLRFNPASTKRKDEILLKPYFQHEPGRDFFAIPVPADAKNCAVSVRFANGAKMIRLNSFTVRAVTPLDDAR